MLNLRPCFLSWVAVQVYSEMVFEGKHTSAVLYDTDQRAIVINGEDNGIRPACLSATVPWCLGNWNGSSPSVRGKRPANGRPVALGTNERATPMTKLHSVLGHRTAPG